MIYYVIINNLKYPFSSREFAIQFANIKRKEGYKVKVVKGDKL